MFFKKINTTESYIYYHSVYTLRPGLFDRNNFKKNNNDLTKLETFARHEIFSSFHVI